MPGAYPGGQFFDPTTGAFLPHPIPGPPGFPIVNPPLGMSYEDLYHGREWDRPDK